MVGTKSVPRSLMGGRAKKEVGRRIQRASGYRVKFKSTYYLIN